MRSLRWILKELEPFMCPKVWKCFLVFCTCERVKFGLYFQIDQSFLQSICKQKHSIPLPNKNSVQLPLISRIILIFSNTSLVVISADFGFPNVTKLMSLRKNIRRNDIFGDSYESPQWLPLPFCSKILGRWWGLWVQFV